MLISQWDCKTRNDTCEDIKKLSGAIKFVGFVNKTEEAFVDSFSNHFSSGYQLNTTCIIHVWTKSLPLRRACAECSLSSLFLLIPLNQTAQGTPIRIMGSHKPSNYELPLLRLLPIARRTHRYPRGVAMLGPSLLLGQYLFLRSPSLISLHLVMDGRYSSQSFA